MANPPPIKLNPDAVNFIKIDAKGLVADVKAQVAASTSADTVKAAILFEIEASGAQAVKLDFHQHAVKGASSTWHFTLVKLF